MKSLWILLLGWLVSSSVYAQSVYFGVKPGMEVQSSQIGLSIGGIIPYIGFDVMSVSAEADIEYRDYYDRELASESIIEAEGSAGLIIPHLGAKYIFPGEETRPYVFADVFKSFVMLSAKAKSVQRDYYYDEEDVEEWDLDGEESQLRDTAKEMLSLGGMTIGGGVEYFFSEKFSVGGEYGMRWISSSADFNHENEDEYDDWKEEWKGNLAGSFRLSYSTAALNYYF